MEVLNLVSSIFYAVISWFANLLPVSSGFGINALQPIGEIMNTGREFGFVIPWQVTFDCLYAVVVFEVGLLIFKLIMWGVRLIRG
jgi:hypothetical protein